MIDDGEKKTKPIENLEKYFQSYVTYLVYIEREKSEVPDISFAMLFITRSGFILI